MPAGRPPTFESPDLLQQSIELYFATCKAESNDPTITGLAYAIGFESRQSFYDYELKEEFAYTIKRARLFVETYYEKALKANNCAGSIFALKNFGWRDKNETEITGKDGQPFSVTLDLK